MQIQRKEQNFGEIAQYWLIAEEPTNKIEVKVCKEKTYLEGF